MGKSLKWSGLILAVLLAAGCGSRGKEAEEAEEAGESFEQEARSAGDAGEGVKMGERILSERETQDGAPQGRSVRIYHSDAAAEDLCVNTVRVEEVTPEILVWSLASYGMLPDDVEVEGLQKKKDGEALMLDLELSEEFEIWFAVLDPSYQELALGSLANTFLDAYEGEGIQIASDGKNVSGGYQERYPYQEASYTLEWIDYEAQDVQIRYPQLRGVADQELEERWNERIRERVLETAEQVEPGASYEETCTVETMNDEILSLLMEGRYRNTEASYPSVVRCTYNIDMASGVNIRLAHTQDVERLAENLMGGIGYMVQEVEQEEFLSRLSILYIDAEQLASCLKGYDFGQDGDLPTGYSYQKDGCTHLCMEIPHALGDYVDVALTGE